MATGVQTRENGGMPYAIHAMQQVVTFDQTNIASGVPAPNSIPQDSQYFATIVTVTAAFNGTTPVLVVGTNSSSFNNMVASGDLDESATGTHIVFTGADVDFSSGPLLPYVKYSDAVAGTTGRAVITYLYIPKIDRA